GDRHSHQATSATPAQSAPAAHPATTTRCPAGTAAAVLATRSSSASPNPDPAATRCARPVITHDSASASTSPGTASPASGIATRFASTPTGATVPNVKALM